MLYELQVKREVVADLRSAQRAQINAIVSNSAYLESKGNQEIRLREIQDLNDHYENVIDGILDPQPEVDLMDDPLMAAGVRGLDKLRWEMAASAPPGTVPEGL